MPQATDELRHLIRERFGDLDPEPPEAYLKERGFDLVCGHIAYPDPFRELTEVEIECIEFLCDEYDYMLGRKRNLADFTTELLVEGRREVAKYADELQVDYQREADDFAETK